MASNWTNKPVTILGLSKSGVAVARYLAQQGAQCFLSETVPGSPNNQAVREELQALGVDIEMGGHTSKCFEHSDLVIVSPGVPPHSSIIKQLTLSGKEIISEVELAYRETSIPIVGVTGTNGKTTVVTLTTEMLQAAGKRAQACGNIGLPMIDYVKHPLDFLVVELSSYQLTFSPSFKAQVAVFTNLHPDHLDWHGSEANYRNAKKHLFVGENSPKWVVLNAADPLSNEIAQETKAKVLWYSHQAELVDSKPNAMKRDADGQGMFIREGQQPETLWSFEYLQIPGVHNLDNALSASAAIKLLEVECSVDAMQSMLAGFKGVEHRLEYVQTVNDVAFYNDSKATNPEATQTALAAFEPKKVVLIAGGRDKNTNLEGFVNSVTQYAQHVVLTGEAIERFAKALEAGGYTSISKVPEIKAAIHEAARVGNATTPVLFSPACASFDCFKNFEERGNFFKETVSHIPNVTMSSS